MSNIIRGSENTLRPQRVKYARSLLEENKTGTLQVTKQELEQHIKDQLSDNLRAKPLGSPGHVPRPPEPSTEFDTSPPRWAEVKQAIERARAASAPGPNGVPYKVFKNCPGLLKALWRLMVAVWKAESIPPSWCKAVTTFIPKPQSVQRHRSAQRGGENLFLCLGQTDDELPPGEQVRRHQLPEGRRSRIPWLRGTFSGDLGTNPGSQTKQSRPARSLA